MRDIGAWLTLRLADPLARLLSMPVDRMRVTVTTAGHRAILLRALAWLAVGGVALIAELVVTALPTGIVGRFIGPVVVAVTLVGLIDVLKGLGAGYLGRPGVLAAGRFLRWLLTPGNRDLVIAAVGAVALVLLD